MGDTWFFVRIIVTLLCIVGSKGQETSMEVVDPADQPPDGFIFNMDRTPGQSHRIINGGIATAHEFPFQVGLHVIRGGKQYLCGGSLLSSEWVLTAAHCVDKASSITVILGAHNIQKADRVMKLINTTEFRQHEAYNSKSLRNDIGLVKITKKVTLNNFIQPVTLNIDPQSFEGKVAKCIGWGETLLGKTSNILRFVDLEIISNSKCKSYRDFTPYITNKHLCTTGEGFVGSCQGDSGGPLLLDNEQIAIVSFGSTKCDNGLPSAFTRVSEHIDWIVAQTGMHLEMRSGVDWCKMRSYMKAFMLSVVFLNYL